MKNIELTLAQIRDSFDYMDGGNIVDSYDYVWKTDDGEAFELFIHAPNRKIDPQQVKEFNLFLKNRTAILSQMDVRMRALLQKKGVSQKIIDQPLEISILSVTYQGKDFEFKPCNHAIELICTKSYKSFLISRGYDIVAQVKKGEVLIIFDEIN